MTSFGESNFSVSGEHGVYARLDGLARRAAEPSPTMWNRVGTIVRHEFSLQFRTQGAHFHTPWKPLTPKYRAWKLAHGFGRRGILVQTGDMRNSFTGRGKGVMIHSGTSAQFGSRNRLAPFHQYGTRRHGKQINPPRPIVVATPEFTAKVMRAVADYILGNSGPSLPTEDGM